MAKATTTSDATQKELISLRKEVEELRKFKQLSETGSYDHLINALHSNDDIYRILVENAFDAIYLLRDKRYEYVNPRFCELTGYSFEELTSEDFDYNLLLTESSKHFMQKRYQGRRLGKNIPDQYNIQIRNKKGSFIDVEVSTKSVGKKGEVLVLGIMRNITDRKQVEEEMKNLIVALRISKDLTEERAKEIHKLNKKLMESEQHLRDLNISKDKFFSIISHDLRGPFSGFLGLSKTLASDFNTLSIIEVQEIAKDMHDSAEHLFRLLENLLQWSRIQRKAVENNPEMIPIREVAELCFNLQAINAKQKQIVLLNEIDYSQMVFADLNATNTILRNLISNAVKFTRTGGEIKVSCVNHNKQFLEIHVSDNGVGMEESTMQKLFKIDEHVTKEGTAQEQGTGLGLILCKELIELSGGKIWVESIIDKGTTFKFTLYKKQYRK